MRDVMALAMVFLALETVVQKRPLRGVLVRVALSVFAVLTYAFYMAPDVALAEAMVGALLMTFVYVLLLRTPGTLRVGYVPTPILFEERPYGYDGLEHEIVRRYASTRGYTLEYTRFDDPEDLKRAFEEEFVDLACGPFVGENGILETVVFELEDGREVDFLSMDREARNVVNKRRAEYVILSRESDFREFLDSLRRDGRLAEMVEKFAGGRS